MSSPDDTTDRLFPHQMVPESGTVERPIPLAPSIREEFCSHRRAVEGELRMFRKELAAALARLTPEHTAKSIGQTVKRGALAGLRYGSVAVAAGELGAQLAAATGHPEVEGPLRVLMTLLGG